MGVGEGHGAVRIVDTSGNTAQFDTSGRITIAGGSITASISGDTVIAKVSGEVVNVQSGSAVRLLNVAGTSGITAHAFNIIPVAGSAVIGQAVFATIAGKDPVGGTYFPVPTTFSGSAAAQGSGLARILVCISGDPITISGNIVTVSGNTVNMAAAVITAPTWLTITGNSGGTTLTSQTCTMVRLMNLSGNGTMLVGGTGTAAPVSGTKGIMLWPGSLSVQGTEMDFPVNNANLLSVVAHTSGNNLAYMTFG